MQNMKENLKNNKLIFRVVTTIKKIYFHNVKRMAVEVIGAFRKHIYSSYRDLEIYKDKYKGDRCFIVCTGPSLTFEDLQLIKNEYSFGMNSIIKVFNATDWRPTFYGIQDIHVYQKMKDDVMSMDNIFVADDIVKNGLPVPHNAHTYPLNFYGHEYFNFEHPEFRFSDDITANVYDGFSITYSLMQIAYYMGFSEIYLLGCDCSYVKDPEKQHFVSSGHVDPNASLVGALQSQAYEKAKEFCKTHNLRIYNATRGGNLEIFERVKLEEVINDK